MAPMAAEVLAGTVNLVGFAEIITRVAVLNAMEWRAETMGAAAHAAHACLATNVRKDSVWSFQQRSARLL